MKIELIKINDDLWRHERNVPVLPNKGDLIVFQYNEKTTSKAIRFRVEDVVHVYENRWSSDDTHDHSLYCAKIYVSEVT